MNKLELLAPAGNRECLETAFHFGADAVYLAGKSFGLRAFAGNFDNEALSGAICFAHSLGKKVYVTVNAVLYNAELEELPAYLRFLSDIGADGAIFSDPAVLLTARREGIALPLHLSTQANTTNYMSAQFWHEQGVKRIVMSRETSLEDIALLRKNTPDSLEIEAFVHGAMCIAHSGRCLLSTAMTGRSGNRGECAQPCRWEYFIHERGYEGQYFQIDEDERGTYIMNSKDLMMIEHIPEMVDAGITSFKVEGRMKSAYYVASVISAYRRAIDGYIKEGASYTFDAELKEELLRSASRGFTTGFFFGMPGSKGQDITREVDPRKYTFCAKVTAMEEGFATVEQRNKFSIGETLEVLSPRIVGKSFTVKSIENMEGEAQESAPHPQQSIKINCPFELAPGDILRRYD